jgi:zinc protease
MNEEIMRNTILCAAIALAFASEVLGAENAIDIRYEKFVLDNGLTVLVHEDHKAPVVSVDVWYHVGSKNEKPGATGFAHLFEHLMFGGSQNAKGNFSQAMGRAGATDLNGTTSADRTNFFETLPSGSLDYALFMESDRMGHFIDSFEKATLDTQRGVVQNEKRQGLNEPYGGVWEVIYRNIYPPTHPYSWTTLGSMEDLNAASLDDVKNWFRTYYSPTNAVLALAGDLDARTIREKVTRYFGDIPPGPPLDRQQEWVAKMTGTHRATMQDRVPQARIYKVWNIPGDTSPDASLLDMVSDCLASGRNSRLYKRLVYESQLATSVSAELRGREIGDNFVIEATARPGQDIAKLEKAIDDELARFLRAGPDPEELKRVQTQEIAHLTRQLQRSGGFGGIADVLAGGFTYTGDPSYLFGTDRKRRIDATPDQLRAVAAQWLSDGQFVLTVEPLAARKTVTSSLDRTKPPLAVTAADPKLPKLQRAQLPNGLKVILAERREVPLVNMWMIEDSGYAADGPAESGLASLTNTMRRNGAGGRSALEIANAQELLGAEISTETIQDQSIVRLSALKENLRPSLALFADVVLRPSFEQGEFERARQLRLATLQREKSNPMDLARRVGPRIVYGERQGYGSPFTGSGTEAALSRLTREDLVRFHAKWSVPGNAILIVVGDTTLDAIMPEVEAAFGSWKLATRPVKNIRVATPPERPAIYLIDKPGSPTSAIFGIWAVPPKNDPGATRVETLNEILGSFGGRLNMNLREDKHYSYTTATILTEGRMQRIWGIFAPVQTDKTSESIIELDKELREIATGRPVTAEELAGAQARLTLTLAGSQETIDQVAASIATIVNLGLSDDHYQTLASKVKALGIADVNQAVKTFARPEHAMWLIIGDQAKIEAGLKRANIAELHVIDTDGNPVGVRN